MKHINFLTAIILFVAVFTCTPILSFAAESGSNQDFMEFSYAGDARWGGYFSADSYKGGAMLLTSDLVSRFDGCRITEVAIANGEFHNQDEAPLKIFFTSDLAETPYYSFWDYMDVDNPLEDKWYTLPEPVEITAGTPFYVGFVAWTAGGNASNEYSCAVFTDGVFHTDLPGGFISVSQTTGNPEEMSWEDEGYKGGMVCIRLRIEGDALPQNVIELEDVHFTDYLEPNSCERAEIVVSNKGFNAITDLDISCSVAGLTESHHFDFSSPIEYCEGLYLNIDVTVPEEGVNIPVLFAIEKVNGETPSSTAVTERIVNVHSLLPGNGFPRRMVVEELGGTGCPWCVRGIVGLDRTFNLHDDGTFIPISVYCLGSEEDPYPFGYDMLRQKYLTHVPSCLINRNLSRYGIEDPSFSVLDRLYDEVTATPAIAAIEVGGYSLEDGWLSVESEVTFAFPEEDAGYSVAYVVTEDSVGPYVQANSYSGKDVDMGGWEDLGEYVPTYYDFLARGISDFYGTPLSVPTVIEPGVEYTHSDKVSMVKVRDLDNLAVIAMLINDKNGCIENACRVSIEDLEESDGVSDVGCDTLPVEYYDLSGRKVNGNPAGGIYIRRQGSTATKIAIR